MRRVIIFLAAAAVMVVSAALFTGCGRGTDTDTLRIFNWAVYTPQSVIDAFEREYGVTVIYSEFSSNEEMLARLRTGGLFGRFRPPGRDFDVVFPSGDYVAIMIRLGMLERLDHSLIPNLANIDPVVVAKATYDPALQYSVPYFFGAAGIAVNTYRVPDFERCISIFSRTDLNEGAIRRMTMLDDPRQVIGDALNYLGFSVNTRNPQEIAAARDHIMTHWWPNLVRFDSSTIGTAFLNEEFWVVQTWAEDVLSRIALAGDERLMNNTVFFFPPGASSYTDNMVILRGSPNVELAHKFINFIHRPDIHAMFVDEFGLPSTVNIPARRYTQATPWFTVEDMAITGEIQDDVGPAMEYFTDAWFTIRVGN